MDLHEMLLWIKIWGFKRVVVEVDAKLVFDALLLS